MSSLPLALRLEKNRLATPNAWLVLLEITLPSAEIFRLVHNTEDITFQGNTYTAINFTIDANKMTSKGEIPTVNLSISNVTRVIQGYIEELSGGIGSTVKVVVVNSGHLTEDFSELTMTFDVIKTECSAQLIIFTLGAPNPLRKRFPDDRYIALHCGNKYKSPHCGYSGEMSTCKHTLEDCRAHSNSRRFRAYIGLNSPGVRFA